MNGLIIPFDVVTPIKMSDLSPALSSIEPASSSDPSMNTMALVSGQGPALTRVKPLDLAFLFGSCATLIL